MWVSRRVSDPVADRGARLSDYLDFSFQTLWPNRWQNWSVMVSDIVPRHAGALRTYFSVFCELLVLLKRSLQV